MRPISTTHDSFSWGGRNPQQLMKHFKPLSKLSECSILQRVLPFLELPSVNGACICEYEDTTQQNSPRFRLVLTCKFA